MKKLLFVTKTIFLSCLLSFSLSAHACTDFRIIAKDGTVLVTRSMEFSQDIKSNLRTSTENRLYQYNAPNGSPGMTWKAKYGYVYLDGMNVDAAIDGINEAGLSFEALYLPSLASYQWVPLGQNKQALPYIHFGDWILSNFKTVDEVRLALAHIYVYPEKIAGMGDVVFPLHFSIYEASGKGIVVEYIDGKLNIYDNMGVMTNSPSYAWHLSNLRNYLNLTPTNPPSVVAYGVTYVANGQGFGMIGLPGDISPPSRFIKTATLLHVALPVDDASGAVNLAEHIINNVDIPLGLAREPTTNIPTSELTQWVVFKDLTHKILYYRTYADMSLRMVMLDKLNLKEDAIRLKMPVYHKPSITDVTEQFSKSN